ncbi:MAG: Ig-like domain-containing protein [Myxococcales bacterium]|nr:Ig-like domain-containing protein [Myxococcales bacterium]
MQRQWTQSDGSWRSEHPTALADYGQRGLILTAIHQHAPIGSATRESPVVFGRSAITAGGHKQETGRPMVTAKGNLLRVDHGWCVEELSSAPDGFRQEWTFLERPPGRLNVEMAVAGRLVESNETGLHFAAGSLLVRYGHATWVDARGIRTPVPAVFTSGSLHMEVPADVVASSTYPAVLDPIITPELSVDEPTRTPDSNVGGMAAAFDGTNTLVVWTDQKNGSDIRAARVTSTGQSLDPMGFILAGTRDWEDSPAVSWDGTNYLVVWRASPHPGFVDSTLKAVRVSPAGVLLDGMPIMASGSLTSEAQPITAWNGASHFVAWTHFAQAGQELFSARVAPNGSLLDPQPVRLGTGQNPAIAWGGATHLLAWTTPNGVRVGRFDLVGRDLDDGGWLVSSSGMAEVDPSVAWSGSSFLVAWSQGLFPEVDLYGARVSPSGQQLDRPGLPLWSAPGRQVASSVGANGSGWVVAWVDWSGALVSGVRVDQNGQFAPLNLGLSPSWGPKAVVQSTNADSVVFDPATAITMRRVSPSGSISDAGPSISLAAEAQHYPAVATNGSDFLMTWYQSSSLRAARISRQGELLDPMGFTVAPNSGQGLSSVAWGAGEYLVVWCEPGPQVDGGVRWAVRAVRVTPGGRVVGAPILVTELNTNTAPIVSSSGSGYLVVWGDPRTGLSDVVAARLDLDGGLLDLDGIEVTTATHVQVPSDVAWDGTNYLVVWSDRSLGVDDVVGARVSPDGSVLDPVGIPVSRAPGPQWWPVLAWGDGGFLVAWGDGNWGSRDARAVRVDSSGQVLDSQPIEVTNGVFAATPGGVAWNGQDFVLVWDGSEADWGYAARFARVSPQGVVLDDGGTRIGASHYNGHHVDIACGKSRQCLAVSSEHDYRPAFRGTRVKARFLVDGARPVATAQSLETPKDAPVAVMLSAVDADGDPLEYELVAFPRSGSLSGSPPALVYTPRAGFEGRDDFVFQARDGVLLSLPAVVQLVVGDAGVGDSGTPDAGTDGGPPTDAGAIDGGSIEDGGSVNVGDAGPGEDAGHEDGGSVNDAGLTVDAGYVDDADAGALAIVQPEIGKLAGGCGCTSSGTGQLLLLLGLILRNRRR